MKEINFFVVHEFGTWNEKELEFEKRRMIDNSEKELEGEIDI